MVKSVSATALIAFAAALVGTQAAPIADDARSSSVQEQAASTLMGMPIVSIPPIPDSMKGVLPQIAHSRRGIDKVRQRKGATPTKRDNTPSAASTSRHCKRPSAPQQAVSSNSSSGEQPSAALTIVQSDSFPSVSLKNAAVSKATMSTGTAPSGAASATDQPGSQTPPAPPTPQPSGTGSAETAQAVQAQVSQSAPPANNRASTTSASPPAASSGSGDGSGGSGSYDLSRKAGIAINWPDQSGDNLKQTLVDTVVSWGYSWVVAKPPNFPGELEFVPMLHDMGHLDEFNKVDWKTMGYKYAMTLNEPNHAKGSTMYPADAASKMKELKAPDYVKLGAPSLANEGTMSAADWYSKYTAAGGPGAFLPVHYYGDKSDGMISFLKDLVNKFPSTDIWVTEYACETWVNEQANVCDDADAQKFHDDVKKYMKGEDRIKRYSAEGMWKPSTNPGNGNLLMNENGDLTLLGKSVLS